MEFFDLVPNEVYTVTWHGGSRPFSFLTPESGWCVGCYRNEDGSDIVRAYSLSGNLIYGDFNTSPSSPLTVSSHTQSYGSYNATSGYGGLTGGTDITIVNNLEPFSSVSLLSRGAFRHLNGDDFQISYIPVNCQLSGPTTANSGDSVTVQVTPNEGHVISLPQQGGSISVYNENGYIPFTWDATNKTITFTAP